MRRDEKGYENPIMVERFRPDEAARAPKEIDEIARGDNRGSIWMGDESEKDWAQAMLHFSLDKKEKFHKTGFKCCAENWLLIYDSWKVPALNEPVAAKFFFDCLLRLKEPLPFQRIFVERPKNFWQFTSKSCFMLEINDVWGADC